MELKEIVFKQNIIDKLESKHHVSTNEVREIFENRLKFHFIDTSFMEEKQLDPIPDTLEEFIDFWETHDMAEYEDEIYTSAKVDINIKSVKHIIAIEPELSKKISRLAIEKGISSETLINLWLKEKLHEEEK